MSTDVWRDVIESAQIESGTARLRAQTGRLKAGREKLATQTALKMQVESRKMAAEASKLERESRWHPVMMVSPAFGAAAALIAAMVGIVKMLLIG